MTTSRSALEKLRKQGYLTLTGLSQLLSVSLPVLLRLANSGKLEDIRVGSQRRVYAIAISTYIANTRDDNDFIAIRIREALQQFLEDDNDTQDS